MLSLLYYILMELTIYEWKGNEVISEMKGFGGRGEQI